MSDNGLQRLSKLGELNANPNWVNTDLYRLMFKKDLYITAYERLKSSPGNMTAGSDGDTIDGFSMKLIESIITSMRDESYQFARARRVYIPKANGKLRPLGIPSAKDKVVQEVIRMILESIYDGPTPTFKDCSHGFRPGMGTHSCLKEVRTWHNVSWFIEGDIKACFDEIDHHVLISLLSKRITDGRFLDLIWKALSAGYLEGAVPVNSLSGTPQGSIVSPILANVYLHELDVFIEDLKAKYEKGTRKRANPAYTAIVKERRRIDSGKKRVDLMTRRELEKRLRQTPSLMHDDPEYIRIKYVRYADDWILGLDGPKVLAESLREQVGTFLSERLKLTLSVEKTHIRHARREEAFFLGTNIKVGRGGEPVHRRVKWADGREFVKRANGWTTQMTAPVQRIIDRLAARGFCDKGGNPKAQVSWTILDLHQIVMQYNSVLRGLLNYYSFANNYGNLRRIQFILTQSALHTFGRKLQLRKPSLYKRFGPNLRVDTLRSDGKVATTELALEAHWASKPMRFQAGAPSDRLITYARFRSRTKLEESCCICGSPEGVEMHHLRHVRKGESRGFAKIMSTINRKQIPVCALCHDRIHAGEYDGLSLNQFANPVVAIR